MGLYQILVNSYNQFLAVFPEPLRWFITLVVLIGIIGSFVHLVRRNVLWVIVFLILLPFIIPVFRAFINDFFAFVVYLWQLVAGGPK